MTAVLFIMLDKNQRHPEFISGLTIRKNDKQ